MTTPLDQVSQLLDNQYPRSMTANGIAIALQETLTDVQNALNRLIVLKRVLQVSASGVVPAAFQGDIALVKQQLNLIAPNSTTAGTVASILGLTPNSVQDDLDRLVLLGQAQKVILPVTGAIQYASVPGT
jgi:hypothetical protein